MPDCLSILNDPLYLSLLSLRIPGTPLERNKVPVPIMCTPKRTDKRQCRMVKYRQERDGVETKKSRALIAYSAVAVSSVLQQ